ncbi:MAG: family 78 glycoside hydrolase catalytic domain [Clostridia bacterium]|nr:family 78 glycoside hydrolase catalytic domain [Clostridia bacterium]
MHNLNFVWANGDCATYEKAVPAPIFRKTFTIDGNHSAVSVLIGATGFYELYLNGKRITKGYLAPYISNPDDAVFFDKYDLTDLVKVGENTLEVMLGNGFSNPLSGKIWGHTNRCAAPSFALGFECGNLKFTAEDMLWQPSQILFDDLRVGVLCDMSNPPSNDWYLAQMAPQPKGARRLTTCEPVKEIRRIRAKSVRPGALRDYRMRDPFTKRLYNGETVMGKSATSGGYIYDFGENNSGVPCLKIKGKKGQRIEMQFSELLFEGFVDYINVDVYPDGCCQRDVYVCGSDEEEIFIPPFTYHGFRYCYVYGITKEQATPDLLEYVVLHNLVTEKATFTCSDQISNEIFDACRRSDESNLVNIITDCPHREKNGWTGDVAISAEHYLYNLGAENCMRDWLFCVRQAQNEAGRIPLVVPSAGGMGDSPVWDSALYQVPYYIYRFTGDESVITENAHSMLKNMAYYMENRDQRGIVESGMGDWLPVDKEAATYSSPLGYTCSAVLMECCRMASVMLKRIGRKVDAQWFENCRQALRKAIRAEYNKDGIITAGKTEAFRKPTYTVCQTSQALGLYAGVFDEGEKQKAVDCLVDCINAKGGSFDCGFLGLRTIFHVLSQYGHTDLAYSMITKPTHPSYANMIYRGETTVWERFAEPGKRIGSHNHHFMGDVSAWYLSCVAGINVNPNDNNPNHILINPHFVTALDFAQASYVARDGKISVKWQRDGEKITLNVKAEGNLTVDLAPQLMSDTINIVLE